MKRVPTFLAGFAVGAIMMFFGLKYQVVRATGGYHIVPKAKARLASFYADVREYDVDDWRNNKQLVLDITQSNNDALKEEAAKAALGNTFSNAIGDWSGTP